MIVITCPAFSPNGGIRIILEVANRLGATIFTEAKECTWFDIKVPVTDDIEVVRSADIVIISSPHHVHLLDLKLKRPLAFFQMMEHLFNGSKPWQLRCKRWYQMEGVIISQWGMNELRARGNKKTLHYIGNGVNFDHFPIENKKKDGKTILLESPVAINKSKDKSQLAIKVAKRLGLRVIGYGVIDPDFKIDFYKTPDLKTLNELYSEATIMIKATVYDFRSTSPLEAGTKGTVTARAIMMGDDDLRNEYNCLRVPYDENELYRISLQLIERETLRETLANNMIEYLKSNSWDTKINLWKQALGLF